MPAKNNLSIPGRTQNLRAHPKTALPMSQTIEMIKADALMSIEVGTNGYQRLQQATLFLLHEKTGGDPSAERMADINRQINQGDIAEEWVSHYETLLTFVMTIEQAARRQGMIETHPVEALMQGHAEELPALDTGLDDQA